MTNIYNSDPEDKDERSWIEKRQDEDIEGESEECNEEDKVDPGEIVSMVVDSVISTIFFW